MANIPEGYELLAGRGRENALKALKLAEERGFDPSAVSVASQLGGFLIPIGDAEPVEQPPADQGDPANVDSDTEPPAATDDGVSNLDGLTVADLKAIAEERKIDLGGATLKADIIAAIEKAAPAVDDTKKED